MKAFISHASEDKDDIARPLAIALRERHVDVWFDEFSLKPGDSLRASIDKGLASCDFGIVVLSPFFFKKSWPQKELNGLFARDLASKKSSFLFPIWHNITFEDVLAESPMLADCTAIKSLDGTSRIAEKLLSTAINDFWQDRSKKEYSSKNFPLSRYYNPPKNIPKFGYQLKPGSYSELIAQLRPRELLIAFGKPRGTYYCAGHVMCEERMLIFENSWWQAPEYYGVEYHKLKGGFDKELSEEEIP